MILEQVIYSYRRQCALSPSLPAVVLPEAVLDSLENLIQIYILPSPYSKVPS